MKSEEEFRKKLLKKYPLGHLDPEFNKQIGRRREIMELRKEIAGCGFWGWLTLFFIYHVPGIIVFANGSEHAAGAWYEWAWLGGMVFFGCAWLVSLSTKGGL
jgi:hypothetical protein